MWRFEFDGVLMGAVRMTQAGMRVALRKEPNGPVARYLAQKDLIRCLANAAGVPDALDHAGRYKLTLEVFVHGKPKYDLDNQVKAILDACFPNDRRVLEIHAWTNELCNANRARVTLERTL